MRTILRLLPFVPFVLPMVTEAVEPPTPIPPVPTASQLAWQRLEMTMFLHFGVNTFTDREWGDGKEDPAIFNPSDLDAAQWVRAAKDAGFGLLILTAKHHDGFCLWPSAYTDHSVKRSPWKEGKGDVVRAFVDACREAKVKIGLYLSPWDRHERCYGTDAYNTHFQNQLAELLSNYGTIDELWFDGACGEGPNGKKQVYDWEAYYGVIRKLQPKAVIAICGPDVRWVGNESGVARPGESSVQKRGSEAVWYPAECDVSIRPGWFYHAHEDAKVKPLDHLLGIYFKSVGRNSVLLLNVPPDRRGRFADADLRRLKEFRAALDALYRTKVAGPARASSERGAPFAAAKALDGNLDTFWAAANREGESWLEIDLQGPRRFNLVNIQEAIRLGERVLRYRVEAESEGRWTPLAHGTVVGHRNLHGIPETTATKVRLVVERAKACPAIAEFGVFLGTNVPVTAAPLPLTAHKSAKASNVHGGGTVYGGDKAVDQDLNTRWATSDETRACWLEVDLGKEETVGRLAIHEFEARITKFELQVKAREADPWKTAYAGGKAGKQFAADFPPVTARHVRLQILEATFAPTIWEFQVFPPAK